MKKVKKGLLFLCHYMGELIIKLVMKFNLYYFFPSLSSVYPKGRHKLLVKLLEKGKLHLAYKVMKKPALIRKHTISPNEIKLHEKIRYIKKVLLKGCNFNKKIPSKIEHISILYIVHNSFPFHTSGYAIRTHTIISHLIKHNLKITITTRPGYPWDLQTHRELKERPLISIIDNVKYTRLQDKNKLFKKGADIDYITLYAKELIKEAKKNKSTILHANSNYLNGLGAILAAQKLKLPVVYEMRGLWYLTRLTLDRDYKHSGMFEYEKKMETIAAQNADRVVTLSIALKNLLIQWGIDKNKIDVVPNSIDTKYFIPQSPNQKLIEKYQLKEKIVIGFIGSITGYEGLEELIISVNQLINEGKNIALIIVGEGRDKEKLQNLSKSKNIIFVDKIPFEEVQHYYSIFDICPFPRNNYEVCQYIPPLKILEAMAMKKAIIISDLAPLKEIISHNKNGIICKANNIPSLKEAITLLYHHKELRERLSTQAFQWVIQHRTQKSMTQKYQNIYQKFLGDSPQQ